MKVVVDRIEGLTERAVQWEDSCHKAITERDEARREVERLEEVVSGHDELVHHLNKKISDLEMDVSVERLAHSNTRAQLAAERAKKSGHVEGTWAWACEYVEKNRGKIAARARSGDEKGMIMSDDGTLLNLHGGWFVANSMDILATDWRVVES